MAFLIEDKPFLERRQFRRIRVSSPIEYKFFNSGYFQQTVTCDISEGGISFLTDGLIPIGTHLYFQARLKNRPQALYGIARVTWCTKQPYEEKFKVGLEFTETGSISKADIALFIEENKIPCYNS